MDRGDAVNIAFVCMINKILFTLVALLSIFLMVVLFFTFAPHLSVLFSQSSQSTDEEYEASLSRDTEEANDLLSRGDIPAALNIYDRLLIEAHDDSTKHGLIFHKANALFLLGELDTTKEAIDILGQALAEESASPTFKAWALANLYRYQYQTQSPEVLNHIRGLSIFSDLNALNDEDFLMEIAKRSDAFQPTMFGKILLALPLVEELDQSEEASVNAGEIEKLAEESRNLQLTETWLTDPYSQMLATYYRALILTAATAGGTDPELARMDFVAALNIVTGLPDSKPIKALAPMTHLHLAYLYLNHPSLDETGVLFEEQMAGFINRVGDMDRFDLLVTNAMANPNSKGYRLFSDLSAKSEEFQSFLQEKYAVTF